MLTLVTIVALIVILISIVIAALRRNDSNNYFDQDRQPFYAEPDALVSAGLLYSQRDRDQRENRTYTVTPAGEAGLRAWLREPTNDPGYLENFFSALITPFDALTVAGKRASLHRARLAEYERIEQLLVNRPEWRYALAAARGGVAFERACIGFWQDVQEEEEEDGGGDGATGSSGDEDDATGSSGDEDDATGSSEDEGGSDEGDEAA